MRPQVPERVKIFLQKSVRRTPCIEAQHKQFFAEEEHYFGQAHSEVVAFREKPCCIEHEDLYQHDSRPWGQMRSLPRSAMGAAHSHPQCHPLTGTLGSLSANMGGADWGLNDCSPFLPILLYVFNRAHKIELIYITQELGAWCNHCGHKLECWDSTIHNITFLLFF